MVALDPGVIAGVGAPLEFVEYEAENGATNGRFVGPDRTFATLSSEASGRRAVVLEGQGDYVEFTLSAPATALGQVLLERNPRRLYRNLAEYSSLPSVPTMPRRIAGIRSTFTALADAYQHSGTQGIC